MPVVYAAPLINRSSGKRAMICPSCKQGSCARSQRKGFLDNFLSLAGFRPWRCMKCRRRFYARRVAWEFMGHAHCSRCGNLQLEQLAKHHVRNGRLRWIFKALGVAAYRCSQCRHNFFSLWPLYESRCPETRVASDYSAER